jgi:dihydrofolate synthase/folylpolyglutamate synthase
VTSTGDYRLTMPLLGEHQLENAATAIGVVEALVRRGFTVRAEAIVRGFATVQWPGRLEVISRSPLIVVDGAHNPYSLARLGQTLGDYLDFSEVVLVAGVSADKNLRGMVKEMATISSKVVVTRSRHPKAAPPDLVAAALAQEGISAMKAERVNQAMEVALSWAGPRDLVLATGSLFVVAEAIEAIKGIPPELYPELDKGIRATP